MVSSEGLCITTRARLRRKVFLCRGTEKNHASDAKRSSFFMPWNWEKPRERGSEVKFFLCSGTEKNHASKAERLEAAKKKVVVSHHGNQVFFHLKQTHEHTESTWEYKHWRKSYGHYTNLLILRLCQRCAGSTDTRTICHTDIGT